MQQILSEIRDKFRTIRQNSVLLTRSQTFPLHLILRDIRSSEFGDSVHIYLNENQISHMIHTLKGLEQAPCVTSFIIDLEFLKKPCRYGTA